MNKIISIFSVVVVLLLPTLAPAANSSSSATKDGEQVGVSTLFPSADGAAVPGTSVSEYSVFPEVDEMTAADILTPFSRVSLSDFMKKEKVSFSTTAETPLKDVLEQILSPYHITFRFAQDVRSLENALVKVDSINRTLDHTLNDILSQFGLFYNVVSDSIIEISLFQVKSYDIPLPDIDSPFKVSMSSSSAGGKSDATSSVSFSGNSSEPLKDFVDALTSVFNIKPTVFAVGFKGQNDVAPSWAIANLNLPQAPNAAQSDTPGSPTMGATASQPASGTSAGAPTATGDQQLPQPPVMPSTQPAPAGGSDTNGPSIVLFKHPGRILVRATPEQHKLINEIVNHYRDFFSYRVLVDLEIVEVSRSDIKKLGNQTVYDGVGGWLRRVAGPNNVTVPLSQAGAPMLMDGSSSQFPSAFNFVLTPIGTLNLQSVLSAMEENQEATVIARPSLHMLNGYAQEFKQVTTIEYIDNISTTPGTTTTDQAGNTSSTPPQTSTTFKSQDVGIAVFVQGTGDIKSGNVQLLLKVDVSNILSWDVIKTSTESIKKPVLSQKTTATLTKVSPGNSVVIAGFITNNKDVANSGLPGLSKLPIIGWLFGKKSDTKEERELIIIATPRLVKVSE